MIEYILWGFALRFVQCLLEAAPFILAGLFIAAIFQRFFGSAETRRLFGECDSPRLADSRKVNYAASC